MFERFRNLFRQRQLNKELREEFETHLDAIEQEELTRGATPEEARRKARVRFGNPGLYHESTRDADVIRCLDDTRRDLKIASRQLWRSPTFAVSAVLLLGLGIGVNAAIFTVISSVVLRPLPLPESSRLDSGKGKGRKTTLLITVKIAAFTPMPKPSSSTALTAKVGLRQSWRDAIFRSRQESSRQRMTSASRVDSWYRP